jgi:hypothetical protein
MFDCATERADEEEYEKIELYREGEILISTKKRSFTGSPISNNNDNTE